MRNRASFDKWLMAVLIGAGMVVGGLSSTDKGWIVIGGAVLAVAFLIAAIEVFSWWRKSQGKTTELPTPVVVVLGLIAIPVLAVWGFRTGDVAALLIAAVLVILLALLFVFRNTGPIKIGQFSANIPVGKSAETDPQLAEAMKEAAETGQPVQVAEFKTEIPLGEFVRAKTDDTSDAPAGPAGRIDFKTNIPELGGSGELIRAISQVMTGDAHKALASFRRSAGPRGGTVRVDPEQAVALLASNRYEEALLEVDRALAGGPSSVLRMLRGQALLALGATEEALAEFRTAKTEGAPGVETSIGVALLELGRTDEAIGALESDRGGPGATSATCFYLGEAYRRTARDKEACDQYEEAAAKAIVESQYGTAWRGGVLPSSLVHVGRLDAAEIAANDAIAGAPMDPTVGVASALLAVKRGSPNAGLADLEAVLAVSPHEVAKTLGDPDFASLAADQRGQELLARATAARDTILARVRSRATGQTSAQS